MGRPCSRCEHDYGPRCRASGRTLSPASCAQCARSKLQRIWTVLLVLLPAASPPTAGARSLISANLLPYNGVASSDLQLQPESGLVGQVSARFRARSAAYGVAWLKPCMLIGGRRLLHAAPEAAGESSEACRCAPRWMLMWIWMFVPIENLSQPAPATCPEYSAARPPAPAPAAIDWRLLISYGRDLRTSQMTHAFTHCATSKRSFRSEPALDM